MMRWIVLAGLVLVSGVAFAQGAPSDPGSQGQGASPEGAGDTGGAMNGMNKGNETKVKMDDLPTAVKSAVQREAAGARVDQLFKATEPDGTTRYDARIKASGGKLNEIEFAPDGSVLSRRTVDKDAH